MEQSTCFHCGDNCDKNLIKFQEKAFCCNGCNTVYEIFSENDFTCYYDLQSSPGAIPKEIEGIQGSLFMALFGLGTIPLMTSAISLGKFLNTTVKQRIQKAIPVFIVVIGLLFIIRGLGLGIPYLSPAPATEIATGDIDCH